MNPGPWGILLIAVVVLVLFGRGKISNMMGEVAGGIKAFRKGMADDEPTAAAALEQDRAREAAAANPTTTATYSEVRDTERKDA